jgi:mycoredoxin
VTAFSVALLVVSLLVLVLFSTPVVFPRSPGDASGRAEAEARGVPLIYWRTGCTYCIRLRLVLGTVGGRAVWVNVRRDPSASARVRSVNDGNETVPTVFVGEAHRTNPAPAWVRKHLRP